MLQERWSLERVQQWLSAVEKGEELFQETKAWEILEAFGKQTDEELTSTTSAKLYSLLAKARYERMGRMDHLVESWVNQALEEDSENMLAHELKLEGLIEFVKKLQIPTKFPPIRETDHGSAKKKMAEEYNKMAKHFFRYMEDVYKMQEDLSDSIERLKENKRMTVIEELLLYIDKLREPFATIETATDEYASSLTGVYYSAAQLQQIVRATKEIEEVNEQWNALIQTTQMKQNDETALKELQKMIGLEDVKGRIKKLYQFLHYQKVRLNQGFQSKDGINLHMILTGNPGTGKTHLARLLAKIYYELGLLTRDEVYEVDRTHLVGAYVGQSEENTIKAIERASGGVLFIDEAYSLKRAGAAGNDYGQTVIDTLVSAMTSGKYAGTFAVILAGYPDEMRAFLRANPGLRSRFPEQNHIHIEDYSVSELLQIGERVALENDYLLTNGAKVELKKRIECAQVDDSFGNARTTKNIIQNAIFQKGSQLSLDNAKTDDFVFLEASDFKEKEMADEKKALKQLDELTGLENVKREIHELTSFVKIQQIRREQGLKALPLQVHTIFSGNPGTGKTTVAQLFAEALKEIGLLKRGHLIVASRADLVAGYVGQTAHKTKEKIKDALGGVLFIDEAYSLLSTGQGDFGKEVINTLVQEMTVHKDNLVVILAGYANEIELLLSSNPGLRSRFKKHIHFDDYTNDELIEIILYWTEQSGYLFSPEAKEALMSGFERNGHPANGRYAVDVFERLVQLQSLRLTKQNQYDMKSLSTIIKEDVDKLMSERGE